MLRFSAKLPVSAFFKYSSALIAVLAVVLAGKGVAALQEAGLIDIAPLVQIRRIPVPAVPDLGVRRRAASDVESWRWAPGTIAVARKPVTA